MGCCSRPNSSTSQQYSTEYQFDICESRTPRFCSADQTVDIPGRDKTMVSLVSSHLRQAPKCPLPTQLTTRQRMLAGKATQRTSLPNSLLSLSLPQVITLTSRAVYRCPSLHAQISLLARKSCDVRCGTPGVVSGAVSGCPGRSSGFIWSVCSRACPNLHLLRYSGVTAGLHRHENLKTLLFMSRMRLDKKSSNLKC